MTFRVTVTRVSSTSKWESLGTNRMRGALGAALFQADRELYDRWFDPVWKGGPSGYQNAPRPFVLRSQGGQLQLISFETSPLPGSVIAAFPGSQVESDPPMNLPIWETNRRSETFTLRLHFLTAVELKSEGQIVLKPEFDVVIGRLAERVWALGCRYQGWPLSTDLKPLVARAREVELTAFEWQETPGEKRRSARSGQAHRLGGFTGWADYAGPLSAFRPLLEIGTWTGIGRQTVWGKGAISIGELKPIRRAASTAAIDRPLGFHPHPSDLSRSSSPRE